MNRINFTLLASMICMSSALLAGQVAAQDQPTAGSDPLAKFIGSGTCTGNVLAMGKKPGHANAGKFRGEKTLDGHWVVIHYDEDQSTANPKPFHVAQYFSYDPEKKRYVTVSLYNSDSAYSIGTSAGWKGDSITFDESTDGKPASFRDIFTTGKAGLSSHTGMERDKHGKWIKTDEESCKNS
ncbi:MAG: DUF1579 family protein [Proteobacteria bacterium]|nr:DUF1579 family protein [Pseudomonadota bacterium]